MKIEINVTKKRFFVLLSAFLFLAGSFYVYAFGGSNPQVVGHSLGEIDTSGYVDTSVQGFKIGESVDRRGRESPLFVEGVNDDASRQLFSLGRANSGGHFKALDVYSYPVESGPQFLITTGAVGAGSELVLGSGDLDATFRIKPDNSPDLMVLEQDKVGIGTVSPTEKLDVNGNVKLSGDLIFQDGSRQTSAGRSACNIVYELSGSSSPPTFVYASCAPGDIVMGGGADCNGFSVDRSCPSNGAGGCLGVGDGAPIDANAWHVMCDATSARAYAICCPI